jgi:hypothetical protein
LEHRRRAVACNRSAAAACGRAATEIATTTTINGILVLILIFSDFCPREPVRTLYQTSSAKKKKKKKKKKFLRNSKRNLCSFVSVQMQKINVLTLSIDKLLAEARDGDVKEVPLFMQKPCIQARFLKFPHWSIVFCGFG